MKRLAEVFLSLAVALAVIVVLLLGAYLTNGVLIYVLLVLGVVAALALWFWVVVFGD